MNKTYASKLTKKELIENGITDITKNGKVFRNGKEIHLSENKGGYLVFAIYDKDEQGNKIKIPCNRTVKYTNKDGTEKVCNVETYNYKYATIGVHRAMWAWYFNEVPQGLIIDHIDNNKQNNTLENLQLLTQGANVMKEREFSTKEIKCRLNVPRSFYENKLFKAIEACKEAQLNHDTEAYHKARSLKYMACARLRYWDAHKEEYEAFIEETTKLKAKKEEMHRKAQYKKEFALWKKYFKATNNKAMWRQLILIEKTYWYWSADKIQEKLNLLITNFPDFEQKIFKENLNYKSKEEK